MYDHRTALIQQPALMFGISDPLEFKAMFLKAPKLTAYSGATSSISRSADRVIRTVTSVGPCNMENRTPRIVSHAGFPIADRLIVSLY